jgi:hypothetical protein
VPFLFATLDGTPGETLCQECPDVTELRDPIRLTYRKDDLKNALYSIMAIKWEK